MADATPEYWKESHFPQKSAPSTRTRSMQLLPPQHRDEATSGSHFFTKLPGEIRTQIYRQAFGDRVFHVNLHICSTACWTRGQPCGSAEPRNQVSTSNSSICHDRYWWGSVCNHSLSGNWRNALCTDIHGAHFIVDQSKPSDMTSTGVTGWLMSCQQAHAETVDALYSNTFYFAGNSPLQEFIQLVPRRNLAHIEGLILNPVSIKFSDGLNVGSKPKQTPGVGEIESIVSILGSGMFQNLRELDMKIVDSTGEELAFARQGENQAQRVLAIFDDLMPKMSSQFRRLQIYLEDVLFETVRKMTDIRNKDLVREKRNIEAPEIHDKHRFWRPVLDLSRQCSGYWIAQDNWSSQCFSRITRASAGSASQGLRRIVKF